jgi:transcriptional regulator with XRE-family HTH domain
MYSFKGQLVATGIGQTLRAIRQQWQLSLREVEERSLRFAQERGSQSYQISASWLDRLEREEHELTVNKLVALAAIYSVPTEQLLHSMHPANEPALSLKQLSSPNATILLTEGPLEAPARYLLPDHPFPDLLPDETSLLATDNGQSLAPYRRGIIGRRDLTLDPMIPVGSIVQIDTQKRAISLRKDWTHESQRPIYFLMTRDGFVCGWCELDKGSNWLTLIPHPLSPASSRRWKYWTEIENVGRVIVVAIRLGK